MTQRLHHIQYTNLTVQNLCPCIWSEIHLHCILRIVLQKKLANTEVYSKSHTIERHDIPLLYK